MYQCCSLLGINRLCEPERLHGHKTSLNLQYERASCVIITEDDCKVISLCIVKGGDRG